MKIKSVINMSRDILGQKMGVFEEAGLIFSEWMVKIEGVALSIVHSAIYNACFENVD